MTVEKIRVKKEVAEAIEKVIKCGERSHVIREKAQGRQFKFDYKPLNNLDLLQVSTALLVGYTIEKTPHELIEEHYKRLERMYLDNDNPKDLKAKSELRGIAFTLNTLGIKIKGVNDDE